MFMGTYYNSIDAKNRMIVPSKHRDKLGGRCILTKSSMDPCLCIYTVQDWEAQAEKMARLPESDPAVRRFVRESFANATECEVDRQGRIVIPNELKKYAEITKDLVTMGAMKKVEIWAKEVWDRVNSEDEMDAGELTKALEKYQF